MSFLHTLSATKRTQIRSTNLERKRLKMESVSGIRRPCFIEEDDGLASLVGMEAGFSGSNYNNNHNSLPFFSRSFCYGRRGGSYKNLAPFSPRSARFYDPRFEDYYHLHQPHFLESCFLCKKPLGDNKDIFMYRGDTPFCSEECRQEQIEIDEAQDNKNWNLPSSMKKTLRRKDQRNSSISPSKQDRNYPSRAGTVAAG